MNTGGGGTRETKTEEMATHCIHREQHAAPPPDSDLGSSLEDNAHARVRGA